MSKRNSGFLLAPSFGIVLFLSLSIYAASVYPGGSRTDKEAQGFSILHNYWCDLFDFVAYNGVQSPSRPIAIAAMFVLSFSFAGLWFLLPKLFDNQNNRQKWMQWSGGLAMLILFFLFTRFHEEVINFGGLLGGLALILTFLELYQAGKKRLLSIGILCLVLCCFNYFIYQTKILLPMLALTQKLTFLLFFVWGMLLNIGIYQNMKKK